MRTRIWFARLATATVLLLLAAEFLGGLGTQLGPGIARADMQSGHGPVTAMLLVMARHPMLWGHAWLGVACLVMAVVALAAAVLSGRRRSIAWAVLGLVGVAAASYGGLEYLRHGGSLASYVMGAGFLASYSGFFMELAGLGRLADRVSQSRRAAPTPAIPQAEGAREVPEAPSPVGA